MIVEWKGFVVLDVAGGEVSTKKKPGLHLEPCPPVSIES